MNYRRIRLNELRQLTVEEFGSLSAICTTIKEICQQKQRYIIEKGVNPQIANGDANWSEKGEKTFGDDLYERFRFIADNPRYEVINRLRLYSQLYSGYQLVNMSFSNGNPVSFAATPEDPDQELDKLNVEADVWIDRYSKLIRPLPRWMVVNAPKILGEIGFDVNGAVVNFDVMRYQECLNALYYSGILKRLKSAAQARILS